MVDAKSGEPLPYVCIYVTEGKGAWTNDEGDAILQIEDGEQVKISCVGYKTLLLKKSELTNIIKLTPLTREMQEVSVETDEVLLERVAKKLNKEANRNSGYRVPFFSRISMQAQNKSEMVECFLEAGSVGAIRLLKLFSGLYYSLSSEGASESSLQTTDIHHIFYLGPTTENDQFWKGYEGPLHPGVTSGWLKRNYHLSSEIYNDEDGEGLRCITLVPKFKNAKLMEGKAYVRPYSSELASFEGKIETDVFITRGGVEKELHPAIDFVINYTRRKGFTEVDNMTFTFATEDVKCRSVMINMEEYDFGDLLTWPKMLGKNFITDLEDVGYNYNFDRFLSVMKRTEEENDLTNNLLARSAHEEISGGDNNTAKSLPKWMNALPQEKVYLHLDNTGYFKGETIWFKAYVVRTDTEKRGNLSSVLYVDLVSPQGDVIDSKKILVNQGIGAGSITLDNAVMPTGFYELRAYTRYMTNWSKNSCFSRIIPIFREPRKDGDFTPVMERETRLTAIETEKQEKVAFYPEGGYLVKGLPSRLAYIIKGKRGMVELPASDHNSVEINIDGSTRSYRLPQAQDEGISMKVDALRDDSLLLDIWATSGMIGKELGYALIHSGKVLASEVFSAKSYQHLSVSRDELPDGVSQITVFDTEAGALADRFVFRQPEYKDSLQIQSTTAKLLPCGKVSMDITAEPYTSLSFSVMDANGMVNGKQGNIKTWMLLGSDIKGYIENPEYYFESDDEEHRKAADLLMMIQGWRRYNWDVMSGKQKLKSMQPYESKLAIDGTIKAKKGTNADVAGVTISATLHGGQESFGVSTVTDSTGYYALILPDMQGEWAMSISASKNGLSDKYIIPINRHFAPAHRNPEEFEIKQVPMSSLQIHHWDIPEENEAVWKKFQKAKGTVLREVSVRKRKLDNFDWGAFSNEKNAQINSTLFYDCEKAVEDYLDRGEEPPSLANWLMEKNKKFKGGEPRTKALWLAVRDSFEMVKEDRIFNIYDHKTHNIIDVTELNSMDDPYDRYEFMSPAYWIPVWRDGLTVDGRPVVWMVNNQFCTITNLYQNRAIPLQRLTSQRIELPDLLEDVKSIYVARDNDLVKRTVFSDEIVSSDPYLIYCFTTQNRVKSKVKGIRYTSFQGFDPVEVFQTEDYAEMPPMDDFRRTLYWNPNVWTDDKGKAHVEFWNNSICTDMIISAEGVTDEGKFVTGR